MARSSPSVIGHWARRSAYNEICDAWSVWWRDDSYLPDCTATHDQFQVILLGDRRACVWVPCKKAITLDQKFKDLSLGYQKYILDKKNWSSNGRKIKILIKILRLYSHKLKKTINACKLVHSLVHSLIHSFTHSLTRSRTRSLIHSFTHLFTHSFTRSLTRSLTHSITHSNTY